MERSDGEGVPAFCGSLTLFVLFVVGCQPLSAPRPASGRGDGAEGAGPAARCGPLFAFSCQGALAPALHSWAAYAAQEVLLLLRAYRVRFPRAFSGECFPFEAR